MLVDIKISSACMEEGTDSAFLLILKRVLMLGNIVQFFSIHLDVEKRNGLVVAVSLKPCQDPYSILM
jgi:hypothetical protein